MCHSLGLGVPPPTANVFGTLGASGHRQPANATYFRFVCMGCERQGEFRRLYCSRRVATTYVGKSPNCSALGLGVLEISVAAGTGADVMAGHCGAGAAGAAHVVSHQP